MKNKFFIFFIFTAIIFSACEKDVLDKGPLDSIDENLVWTSPSLAQLFVNDLYNNIPGGLWREVDDASDVSEAAHSWQEAIFYNTGDVTPSNSPFECWNLYGPIRSANVFLEKMAPAPADEEAFNTIKGEAIFLRAYFYAELVRFYGGVPLIVKPQEITDDLFVSRNTYDECITFISDEMDKAAALLPLSWEDANVGRATKGAAMAVKARMLLYAASPLNNLSNDMVKWQKAADACKAVIDLGEYSLYDKGYSQMFLDDNNQEVIFDIQFGYPFRASGYAYRSNPTGLSGAYGMTRPTQDFIDMYEMANGKQISDPTSGYDPNNPYEGRDPRFYASILYNNVDWRGDKVETFIDGKYGPGGIQTYSTDGAMTGYYLKKFMDQKIPITYGNDQDQANWILIRYAEILLSYAEAEIALGNEDEARAYINMVRGRVGIEMPPVTATGEDLINLCRNERTVELSFEEQRFFDVRRWKIADEALNHPVHKMTITKNDDGTFSYQVEEMEERIFTDKLYRAPIPLSEIQKNKNLVQNPGY
jgi:starch-binding outer membrane protein, SusD/RagB family